MISIGDNSSGTLCKLLPPKETISKCFEMLRCCRAQSCFFQNMLDEVMKKGIDHFLTDPRPNAEKTPDMLGLVFASLAIGSQVGVFHCSGSEWVTGLLQGSHKASECYRKSFNHP